MNKKLITLSIIFLISFNIKAQFKLDLRESNSRGINKELKFKYTEIDVNFPSTEAIKFVESIIKRTGLSINFELVQTKAANLNAKAYYFPQENKRYLIYNEQYLKKIKSNLANDWAVAFVFAHEIGHHLSHHSIDDSNEKKIKHKEELEADRFAGFMLNNLGSKLSDALAICEEFDDVAGGSHPSKERRIEAITKGWTDASDNNKSCDSDIGEVIFINKTDKKIIIITKNHGKKMGFYTEKIETTLAPYEQKSIQPKTEVILTYSAHEYSEGRYAYESISKGKVILSPCESKAIIIKEK